MANINTLLAKAAEVAEAETPKISPSHAANARQFVWDRHFANTAQRAVLNKKLADSSAAFKAAVAATEAALAEELAIDNVRREQLRSENPSYFKDYQ